MPGETLTGVAAVVVSFLATGGSLYVLRRIQLLDVPNARSSHTAPIPRGGGVGLMIGVVTAYIIGLTSGAASEGPLEVTILLGALILAGLGLVDDVRGLSARSRLMVQCLVAIATASLMFVLIGPDLSVPAQMLVLPIAAVWVVGYVNAFNFMDGVNGISALSALVAGAWFAVVGHDLDQPALVVLGLAIAGASAGFLPWNSPKARVFLGDVGSYGLGGLVGIAGLCVVLLGGGWLTALAPVTVYLADTSWTLMLRARRGRSLGEAHRDHVYQRLVDSGWTHLGSAALVAGTATLVCLVVYVVPAVIAALISAILLASYLAAPALLSRGMLKGSAV